eukprot:gene2621-3249_t
MSDGFSDFLLSSSDIAVDPWGSRGILPIALARWLYGFPIYVLFTAYELLLLYWSGTYHNVSTLDSGQLVLDKTKIAFLVFNAIWFSFEVLRVVVALVDVSMQANDILSVSYNIYVAVLCITMLIGFVIYGSLLYKRILKLPSDKIKKKVTLRKLLLTTIIVSLTILICLLPPIVFFFLQLYKYPSGALTISWVIHSLEIILVFELLYIMKPKGGALGQIQDKEDKQQNSQKLQLKKSVSSSDVENPSATNSNNSENSINNNTNGNFNNNNTNGNSVTSKLKQLLNIFKK